MAVWSSDVTYQFDPTYVDKGKTLCCPCRLQENVQGSEVARKAGGGEHRNLKNAFCRLDDIRSFT
jgi:hypothetical protein